MERARKTADRVEEDAVPSEAENKGGSRRRIKRRLSRLTLRILAINLFAVAILFVGVLYLDRYQSSLIQAELEAVSHQANLFARAVGDRKSVV